MVSQLIKSIISQSLSVPAPSLALRSQIVETRKLISGITSDSGLISEQLTLKRACPMCKRNSTSEEMMIWLGFRWMICHECDLAYVENIIADDFHETETYSLVIDHLEDLEGSSGSEGAVTEQALDTLAYLRRMYPNFRGVCDIGCGNGGFLKVMKNEKHSVLGVDVNPAAISATRSKGIPATLASELTIHDVQCLDEPILFTMRQVIEHVRDVRGLIEWMCNVTPRSWALLIETPSLESWCAKKLRYAHRHFYGWAHLQILSVRTMREIAREFNLDLLDVSTYGVGWGLRSWLETNHVPWIYHPFSDEAISRWTDRESVDKEYEKASINSARGIADLFNARRLIGKCLRATDSMLHKLRPGTEEYVRAIFVKR